MDVQAEKVVNWIDSNLPPLSWRIIAMKQIKLLISNKISPAKIDDKTYFNEVIMNAIRESVKNDYGKDLPNNFS
jgi:hypothetical protein